MSKKNPVTHSIPHDLSLEVVGAAARKAINSYVSKYKQVSGKWETPYLFRLQIKAVFTNLNGTVEIGEDAITFKIDHVPAAFSGFVFAAIEHIDRGVSTALASASAKKGE